MKKSLLTILIVGLLALSAQASVVPMLTLVPSAASGEPGTFAGWGFTITSTPTADWVVLSGSTFQQTGGLPHEFADCTGVTGCTGSNGYVDFLSQGPLVVLGAPPESFSASETFDLGSLMGTGGFQILPTADATTVSGILTVSYDVYSQDPNDQFFDPSSYLFSSKVSAKASLDVPEPSSAGMMLAAVPLLLGTFKRKLFR